MPKKPKKRVSKKKKVEKDNDMHLYFSVFLIIYTFGAFIYGIKNLNYILITTGIITLLLAIFLHRSSYARPIRH